MKFKFSGGSFGVGFVTALVLTGGISPWWLLLIPALTFSEIFAVKWRMRNEN